MTTIYSGCDYTVISTDNGATYTVTSHPMGIMPRSFFLQGDDATRYREDWESLERALPDWHGDRVHGWLWDQCDYGTLAEPVSA